MVEAIWIEWLGDMGRGVGNPQRDFIADPQAFVDWIRVNEVDKRPSYCSVQPFSAYEVPRCIDRLFYDFDCKENPEKAKEEVLDFASRLSKFYGITPLIMFSGRKGYHLHAFLQNPFGKAMEKQVMKKVYNQLHRMLLGNAEYQTLDSSVMGDIVQLARIPLTHHEKTGRLCEPLGVDGEPAILSPGFTSFYRERGVSYDICKRALYKAGDKEKERKRPPPPRSKRGRKIHEVRPCISEAMNRGSIQHKMRIAIVAELNAEGWSQARIVDAFSGVEDFDRRKTAYQVSQIIKSGYSPFRCATIQALGECLPNCRIKSRRRLKSVHRPTSQAIDEEKHERVYNVVDHHQKLTGIAKHETVLQSLADVYDIQRDEAEKLIKPLMRDGRIFEPRPGLYKTTEGS